MRTTALRFAHSMLTAVALFLLSITLTNAQEWTELLPDKDKSELTFRDYQNAFNTYWAPYNVEGGYYLDAQNKKVKARGWKQFKRWEWYWEPRVDPVTGEFPSMTSDQAYERWLQTEGGTQRAAFSSWNLMGPEASDGGYAGVGRINCIAYHPSDLNTFWVGAASGGLWETTDGGSNWTILTDHLDVLAISDIVVDPNYAVNSTIYIATGDKDHWDNRSIGVWKSTDGGTTWNSTGINYTVAQGKMVNRLLMDPNNSNILLAATTDGVYKTTDGGTNWNTLLTSTNFIDMEYKPGDFATLYGCRSSGGEIYRSVDGGANWTNTLNTAGKRVELAVTPASAATVYAVICASDNGLFGIYKSTDSGASFVQTFDGTIAGNNLLGWSTDGSDDGGQGWYDLAMTASPTNANTVFIGGVNTWGSTDGGTNWSLVNHWYGGGGEPAVHADKHWLDYRSNGDLFECNDGGVYISTDDGVSWTDKTNTMAISQIYRLGVSQTVPTEVQIGLQDNGTKLITGGVWSDVRGGDGMECLIDYTDANIQYNTYVRGAIRRTNNHWASSVDIQPAGSEGAWVTPYIIDPVDHNTIYAGYQHIYKSTDQGDNWSIIFNQNSSSRFRAMAIAPSNNQVMYVSEPYVLWKTVDGGSNWTNITSGLPGSFITYLAVKDDDPNTVWVTHSTYAAGAQVYESTDGGSNWTSISSGLPSIPANSIVQNRQETSQVDLFVATDVGVYYKEGTANWTAFNDGLPNVDVQELEFYYDDMNTDNTMLRAASYGRGLWETSLLPVSSGCDELFISEYIEGSSFNKCIEIYNPTGAAVDLTGYELLFYFNGSTSPGTTIPLSGTLAAYDVYVVCDNDAAPEFLAEADLTPTSSFFNGDDAIELRVNGSVIDAIGQVGFDPGSSWFGGGCSTANSTLVRNADVTQGDGNSSDTFDPSVEWTCYATDNSDYIGAHTSDCFVETGCDELFISEYIEGSSFNKCIEIYNPTAQPVDLAGGSYRLARYSNGGTSPTYINLTGTIAPYDVHVICNTNAEPSFLAEADETSGSISHNGDDAYEFQKAGVVIDAFGQVGFDPGSGWTGGGCSTANNTLTRNADVTQGDGNSTDTFDPSVEWTCQGNDVSTFLGAHTSDCYVPVCDLTITESIELPCNDNGTPSDPTDDWFSMQFNATATDGGTQFEVVLNANPDGTGGTILATSEYGTEVVVGDPMIPPFLADGLSTYDITVRDASDPTCFEVYTSNPVANCSIDGVDIDNHGGPSISDPCACAGNGEFDEEVVVTSQTGEVWTVSANTGYLDPVTGLEFAIGTPLVETSAGSGVYTLVGQHLDDVGYTLTVQGGPVGVTPFFLTISNECWYPDPSIDNLPADICQNGDPITLMGSALLGDGSGPASPEVEIWFGSGVTNNVFDPAGLAPGLVTVYYGFNAVDDDPDEHHPGCTSTVSQDIEILEIPEPPVIDDLEVCEGQSTVLTPAPGGDVFVPTCGVTGDVVITGAMDGTLSGGVPKFAELYVTADTDLTNWEVRNYYNGNTINYYASDLTALGTVAAGEFIYVINGGGDDDFQNWFNLTPAEFAAMNIVIGNIAINGDDALRLVDAGGNVVDQFGEFGVDGTGQYWEYLDGWAYRVDETGPNGPDFVQAEWTFSGPNALDGAMDNGSSNFPFPIGQYVCTSSPDPIVFNFYGDQDLTILLAEGVTSYDPGTTPATSPETIWITAVGSNGCESAAVSVTITVYEQTFAAVGDNQAFCGLPEGNINISATANYSGYWSTSGSGFFGNSTAPDTYYTTATGDEGTTVVLTWTTEHFVCPDAQASMGVLIVPETEDAEFSYDLDEYCPGESDPVPNHDTGVDGFYTWNLIANGPNLVWTNYPAEYYSYDGVIDLDATDAGTYEITNRVQGAGNLIISGVIDGPLSGGVPKAVEFTALADIADLSMYGFSSANNGSGTTGSPEYTFPAGSSAFAGQHIWVATNESSFNEFFGFDPTFTNGSAPSINGDDAIELYCNGQVIDVFGDVDVNGDYEPWDYTDSWAYRFSSSQIDGEVFELSDWYFGGRDALDGESENATAQTPFPIQTFTSTLGGLCTDNTHAVEVILGDLIDPEITCPADQTIVLGEGECYTRVFWMDPVVTDNCPGALNLVRTDNGPLNGHYFYLDESPYTITYEVTDANGNGPVECSFTVEILGYPDPVGAMVCNDVVQLSLDDECALTLHSDMFLEGGPYQCYNYFEIYVEGYEYLGNVNNLSVAYAPGTYMVTIFDAAETFNNCMSVMVVEDKITPSITCETFELSCNDVYQKDANGNPHPSFSGYPVVEDNCDNWDWEYSDDYVVNGCFEESYATIYRTWTVTDYNNGKTNQCVQEIYIYKATMDDLVFPYNFDGLPNNLPMLECGSNYPVDHNGNPHPSYTGYPFVGDDCTTFEMFYHDRNLTSICGPKILRDWIVVDDCTGEIENHTQIIRITDTQAPSFMVGDDIVQNTKGYVCNADIIVPDIMHLEDVCDIAPQWYVTVDNGFITGDYNQNGFVDFDEEWVLRNVPEGTSTLCYYAIDNCGNEYSECINIEVVDNIPPTPVCEQYKQVSLSHDGTAVVNAIDFDSGSHDNCGPVWFKVLRGSEYNSSNELVYDGGCEDLNGDDSPANGIQVWFDDQVAFCCDDLGLDHPEGIMVTLRVFEVDPGPGPVNPFDMYNPNGRLYGKFNDCWSVVELECKIPPVIIADKNLEVSCEENLDPYQNTALLPDVISVCGYDLEYEDTDKIGDVCEGRIQRTWTATGCDKTVTFVQNIYLTGTEPFDPCTISFPADEADIVCPDDTGNPGYPTWEENPCNIVTAEIVNIDTFTFVDDACYKIVVDWAVIDWCVYQPNTGAEDNVDEVRNRRLVCDGLVVDGYYRYTQILMVTDIYAPEIIVEDACIAVTDGCYAENVVINATATDSCNVDQKFWWKYIVTNMDTWETVQYSYNYTPVPDQGRKGSKSKDNLGDGLNGAGVKDARLTILDPIPIGNYKVEWTAGDGCGNANTATQYFTVVDKKPPTPLMVDITTAFMPGCMVEVCAILFDKGACDGDCLASYDNCSETLYFTFTDILPIIEHPEWLDEHGLYYFDPVTGTQYNASVGRAKYLLGEAHSWDPVLLTACRVYVYETVPPTYVLVTIYVWDQFALNEDCDDGNYDFAEVVLTLSNEDDDCLHGGALVLGGSINQVKTDNKVDDVMVTLDNQNPEYPRYTFSETGDYAFLGIEQGDYTVTATKNDDFGNGVSTLDLILLQKHLLGVKMLDNVYDLIAGDANINGSISAADLFEFRKLILGVTEELSGGMSWRFVDGAYSFVNPLSPWFEMGDAEVMDLYMMESIGDADFVGVKLGDLNGSAIANAQAQNIESRDSKPIALFVDELEFEAGLVEIPVMSGEFVGVEGMQFTLNVPGMDYAGVTSGALNVNDHNFGFVEDGQITFSWNDVDGLDISEGEVLFTLIVDADKAGILSERIRLSSDITPAEIYTGKDLDISGLTLNFNGRETELFTLYQNEPNPFSEITSIGFNLPSEKNYTLNIFDVTGKVMKVIRGEGEKGYNSINMRSADLPAGVLYYQLTAGDESATKKMIIIK